MKHNDPFWDPATWPSAEKWKSRPDSGFSGMPLQPQSEHPVEEKSAPDSGIRETRSRAKEQFQVLELPPSLPAVESSTRFQRLKAFVAQERKELYNCVVMYGLAGGFLLMMLLGVHSSWPDPELQPVRAQVTEVKFLDDGLRLHLAYELNGRREQATKDVSARSSLSKDEKKAMAEEYSKPGKLWVWVSPSSPSFVRLDRNVSDEPIHKRVNSMIIWICIVIIVIHVPLYRYGGVLQRLWTVLTVPEAGGLPHWDYSGISFRIRLVSLSPWWGCTLWLTIVVLFVASVICEPADQLLDVWYQKTDEGITMTDIDGYVRHLLPRFIVPGIFILATTPYLATALQIWRGRYDLFIVRATHDRPALLVIPRMLEEPRTEEKASTLLTLFRWHSRVYSREMSHDVYYLKDWTRINLRLHYAGFIRGQPGYKDVDERQKLYLFLAAEHESRQQYFFAAYGTRYYNGICWESLMPAVDWINERIAEVKEEESEEFSEVSTHLLPQK